jgi:hypothetical protein
MAKPRLPKKVICDNYNENLSRDELEDKILDSLSTYYGYCVNSFNFEVKDTTIYITNIDWDTTE